MTKVGISGLALAMAAFGACGGGGAQVKQMHSEAYDTDANAVWGAMVESLREDYPIVRVLDKQKRRIVTCWRAIDHESGDPGAKWRLFRVILEMSPNQPYRVAVSGRAAVYEAPILRMYQIGDSEEPGWREGRTDRVVSNIHDRLAKFAKATPQETPSAPNPETQEVQSDTCFIHPELLGVDTHGMYGIPIGEKGAMQLSE
jgi:hypothetical protein